MAIHYPCHFLPVVSGVSNQVVLYTGHLIFDYPHHVRFYLGIVPVYLLLHDVVAVRILELVDDGYFLVGFGFRCYLLIIDNNAGMEKSSGQSLPRSYPLRCPRMYPVRGWLFSMPE